MEMERDAFLHFSNSVFLHISVSLKIIFKLFLLSF